MLNGNRILSGFMTNLMRPQDAVGKVGWLIKRKSKAAKMA
jgi:hypothetical protein